MMACSDCAQGGMVAEQDRSEGTGSRSTEMETARVFEVGGGVVECSPDASSTTEHRDKEGKKRMQELRLSRVHRID